MPTAIQNDVKFTFTAQIANIGKHLPKYAEKYGERLTNTLQPLYDAYVQKVTDIRTSRKYSTSGEQLETKLITANAWNQLNGIRKETVVKLQSQIDDLLKKAMTPKTPTEPAQALLRELQLQEQRQLLRPLDAIVIETKLRTAQPDGPGFDLVAALDGAAAMGFPIAPAQLVHDTKVRLAQAANPDLADLATLRDAYSFAISTVEEAMCRLSGIDRAALATLAP